MIVNERVRDYIVSLGCDISPELFSLKNSAEEKHVPIIRDDMLGLLKFILIKEKPKAILEVGTAVGFSALYMHEYAPADATLTTIEKVPAKIKAARRNFEGKERITLLEGDAADVLKTLSGPYDLIFLDAAKGQYESFLADCKRLLKNGGVMITDNVLLEGSIADSRFYIERRDRTIHERMRSFLYELTHSDDLETVILPVGDGAAITYKR